MRAARAIIAALGGVGRANTYTRHHLAMFGQVSWESVPAIPPEMLFFPRQAPFSVYDLSAWSRTIFVPLSIIWAEKPVIALPAACGVGELLEDAAALGPVDPPPAADWKTVFHGIDKLLKVGERVPGAGLLRRRAVKRAGAWMIERLAESDGLSAILPAMANSVLALSLLGYSEKHPLLRRGARAPRRAPAARRGRPAHAALPLAGLGHRAGDARAPARVGRARRSAPSPAPSPGCSASRRRRPGDWAVRNPAPPGGWYFEGRNEFYPDVDDTCMALMVLAQARAGGTPEARAEAIAARARLDDGDAERRRRLGQLRPRQRQALADRRPLRRPQRHDRSQHRRHHGARARVPQPPPRLRRRATRRSRARSVFSAATRPPRGAGTAAGGSTTSTAPGRCCAAWRRSARTWRRPTFGAPSRWLFARQNDDGGWGESIASYDHPAQKGIGPSTPSQTAWALMGLIAAGEADSPAVERGVLHLLDRQTARGPGSRSPGPGPASRRFFISTTITTGTTSR